MSIQGRDCLAPHKCLRLAFITVHPASKCKKGRGGESQSRAPCSGHWQPEAAVERSRRHLHTHVSLSTRPDADFMQLRRSTSPGIAAANNATAFLLPTLCSDPCRRATTSAPSWPRPVTPQASAGCPESRRGAGPTVTALLRLAMAGAQTRLSDFLKRQKKPR